MAVRLSDHFTYGKIFKIVIAPVCMMIFSSIYSIVDGFFIANYTSTAAFAGVNLIFPVVMIVASIGFMLGTGGSALVSKLLGEGKNEEASRTFSAVVAVAFAAGLVFSAVFFFLVEPIARAFASLSADASEEMIDVATEYGQIMIAGVSLFMVQNTFQSFFAVDEKPTLGFVFTLCAGVTNMLLDWLFVGVLPFGTAGAAVASLIGMAVGSVGPLVYFLTHKKGLIRLTKPQISLKALAKVCGNGSSEFVSNISASVVSLVFNAQLLKYLGENGVSAYGIIMYVGYVFVAVFLGYSIGIAPVVGYNFGAQNHKELSNVFKKSLLIVTFCGVAMTALSLLLARPFSGIFTGSSQSLQDLTVHAMRLYSFCYLFCGFSIFGSAFFTALNNGLISAAVSFCRTLVFQLISVLVFPLVFGTDGIWTSVIFAEFGSAALTAVFFLTKRKKYHY